ncbi:MAG: PRC-barrel domain-containing protein [bacterium]
MNNDTDLAAEGTETSVLFTMTDMLRFRATTKDASFPLTELFFDPEQGLLRYVALDVGGWFDRREVIVSAKLIGVPDLTSREVPVEITPEACKQAPEWTNPDALMVVPIAMMPPIMIGPYGGRFAGQTRRKADETADPQHPGNLKVDGFARLNDWVGLPVHGKDGEVGTLVDLVIEPDCHLLSHLIIDTGGFFAARKLVVPYDLLLGLAADSNHVDMNLTAQLLHDSPPLEQFDRINRTWLDSLRAYYQLTPRL